MTALAVDETGIAAALGSSGRVRKNRWGLLWSREMGGVVLVERWKGWQRRDGSLVEQRYWRGGFLKSFYIQIELWDRRSHERQLSFVAHLEVTND